MFTLFLVNSLYINWSCAMILLQYGYISLTPPVAKFVSEFKFVNEWNEFVNEFVPAGTNFVHFVPESKERITNFVPWIRSYPGTNWKSGTKFVHFVPESRNEWNEFRYSFILPSSRRRNEFRSFNSFRSWHRTNAQERNSFISFISFTQERNERNSFISFNSFRGRNEFRSCPGTNNEWTKFVHFVPGSQERTTNFVIRSFRCWTGTNFVHSLFVPGPRNE